MRTSLLLVAFVLTTAAAPTAQTLSVDDQIASAIQPAPADRRAGAAVLGYRDGALTTLREGTNELICLADTPGDRGFSVACYHRELEPYMARGRELIAEGVTGQSRMEQRGAEVESGALPMPREPRTMYVIEGSGFDSSTTTITDAYTRWVIYTPFATAASTGLSTAQSEGGPWIMFPGTAGAHVMITPPR